MDRMFPRDPATGFTLIEVMIALVVLATLLSVGLPLMRGQLATGRLQSETNRFLGAINLARSEAVMRNLPVSLCPSAMAETGIAECSGVYAAGWIVFANADRDKVVDAGADQVLRVFEGLPLGYQLTNRSGTRDAFKLIHYLPNGSSHSPRTFQFCAPQYSDTPSLSIVMNIVGRARLVKDWGECPTA